MGTRLAILASEYFDLDNPGLLFGQTRMPNVSRARWAIAHVLKEDIGWGKKRIGKFLSKDPRAILRAWERAHQLCRSDPLFYEGVEMLREEVFIDPHLRR